MDPLFKLTHAEIDENSPRFSTIFVGPTSGVEKNSLLRGAEIAGNNKDNNLMAHAEAGQTLTAEYLNNLTDKLYNTYLGNAFENEDLYKINWSRIPHFYYNFYVYKYATGFSAATALSQKILDGDENARDAYLHFLSRGNSAYSIQLLQDAGVNMLSAEPIEQTTALLANLLEQFQE